MGISSIRIKNILSFDDFIIENISDINCIVGQNNVGKSNLLKIIKFFYEKLEGNHTLTPLLHSRYSRTGMISIKFNTTKIRNVVFSRMDEKKEKYQGHVVRTLFKDQHEKVINKGKAEYFCTISLTINQDGSTSWSESNEGLRKIIRRLFPFFELDVRRLDLYDWARIWKNISELKFLDVSSLDRHQHIDYINSKISPKSNAYKDYVSTTEELTHTSAFDYESEILNYIKVGLTGDSFQIDGESLKTQSDGTNSHRYLETFLNLMIALSRREFVTPTIYIDEPEIGLHPKMNEAFITNFSKTYNKYKSTSKSLEWGKYNTPYPNVIFSTHSPNIVKQVVKLFNKEGGHQVYHFSKETKLPCTTVQRFNSSFTDSRFLNVFNDNEARLFFGKFILFVEGESELELFGNLNLVSKFEKLAAVDIYRANDVMIKAITSCISYKSIPHLILYDADKVVSIDPQRPTFKIRSGEVAIKELQIKLSRSYFNSEKHKSYIKLVHLMRNNDKKRTLNEKKIGYSFFKYYDFISELNEVLIKEKKTMLFKTTLEGSLINKSSIHIFLEWIDYEIENNTPLGGKGDNEKRVKNIKKSYYKNKNIEKTYGELHASPTSTIKLNSKLERFSKLIRKLYVKQLRVGVTNLSLQDDELLIAYRIAFGGKSDTLIGASNDSYGHLDKRIIDAVNFIKDQQLKRFPCKLSKTHGWLTRFFDFAIEKIDSETSGNTKDFKMKFSIVFPEIYDIVQKF
ncbi:retron Eco8 family effector endonuclease [Shewanella sp. MBTL60-112-B1]|uniref:retron Eco8 family effector endonuclease n=1 Tax=Shewanella sp. MBTL60-112-B1 TaxID=2815916 RepID=UPI001BC6872D|nr:retron Eco8 family effector endonuclease [Shewanella sp. MBTL60-112-B1]GIU21280.1 hypothetical protein TUM4444_40580 [Shewanella sp. MBTL60-112-B1]